MASPHDTDKLTDYLFGDLKPDEAAKLEKHLKTCEPCSDFVAAAMTFHDGLRAARTEARIPEGEVCPDASGTTSTVSLRVQNREQLLQISEIAVVIDCDKPVEWTVALSTDERRIAKKSIRGSQISVPLGSGLYHVEILKDEDLLGRFS